MREDEDIENRKVLVPADATIQPIVPPHEPLQEPATEVSIWKTHVCMGIAAAALVAIVIIIIVVLHV